MNCYTFKRQVPGELTSVNHGYFVTDKAAARYASQYGFTSYSEGDDPLMTEYDVFDGMKSPDGGTEAIVSAPEHPGMAVEDAFAVPTDGALIAGDWSSLEGNTSDIDVTDAFVDPNVALYAVTRTLEITVPVYAASKEGAVAAVKGVLPEALLKASGAEVRTFAHSALKSIVPEPLGDPWTDWLNADRATYQG